MLSLCCETVPRRTERDTFGSWLNFLSCIETFFSLRIVSILRVYLSKRFVESLPPFSVTYSVIAAGLLVSLSSLFRSLQEGIHFGYLCMSFFSWKRLVVDGVFCSVVNRAKFAFANGKLATFSAV